MNGCRYVAKYWGYGQGPGPGSVGLSYQNVSDFALCQWYLYDSFV